MLLVTPVCTYPGGIMSLMRTLVLACLISAVLVASDKPNAPAAAPDQTSGRSIIFLFGPAGAEQARAAARAVAATFRRWLSQPGSAAELRSAGNLDGVQLDRVAAKAAEPLFLEAAKQARDSAPEAFLSALDSAAQALARRPGLRLLVAFAEAPPLSTEGESFLTQITRFCQSNAVRVVLVDPTSKAMRPVLQTLGAGTGGALIHDPKALDSAVLIASAGSKRGESSHVPPAQPQLLAAAALPGMPSDLPVYIRFVRISPRGIESFGIQRSVGAGPGGITTTEGGPNLEGSLGPMRGLLLVQSPLSALHFDTDPNAGAYSARARVTQIARNASGKIVWQASKPVTLRGPLQKLDARRTGNLYYMREVVLPSGPYTLEATVEDLIAGKSGGVREPLRTAMATPGFTVSDALIVRPFNGASDRFEADQVLNYDGNAVAPLLDAVYPDREPFDLRIYLFIYPDIYGEQPELSMEILRNGHVVGRSSLPFTDRIRRDATENSGMSSILGEQKHEFPYLATLRGVRLGPGEYEARMTVRQGRNTLTRSVNFRITGTDRSNLIAAVSPSAAIAAPHTDEDAEIILPEVDPVSMNTGASSMPATDQQRLWQDSGAGALSYTSRLLDFRCNRETRRLTSSVKTPDKFREADSYIEELTYENTKETYRTIDVNGQKSALGRDELKGISSRGEFGSMLKSVFRPEAAAQFKWAGRAMAGDVLCAIFDVDVPATKSNFVLTFNLRQEIAGFHGRVFVDEETNLVRRIVLQGTGLPKDFALQSPTFSLEYGMVRVGENDYLLPLRSVLQVRQGKQIVRNETRFRDYRKFEASSQIKF